MNVLRSFSSEYSRILYYKRHKTSKAVVAGCWQQLSRHFMLAGLKLSVGVATGHQLATAGICGINKLVERAGGALLEARKEGGVLIQAE